MDDITTSIKRYKFGWMYAPDRLEKWLEKQAAEGYNLVEVSKRGLTFYFEEADPVLCTFSVVNEGKGDIHLYLAYRNAGWKQAAATGTSWQQWTIWRKGDSGHEENPGVNNVTELKQHAAKRMATLNSLLVSPVVVIFSLNFFGFMLPDVLENGYFSLTGLERFNVTVYPFIILTFFSMILRSWMYYFRVKNNKDV
ncbi:DUF2812 domain-containing protein [Alteribacter keqinensis]|nr:DUF2812 domain-containing protein [Alteribacter keqinensis]